MRIASEEVESLGMQILKWKRLALASCIMVFMLLHKSPGVYRGKPDLGILELFVSVSSNLRYRWILDVLSDLSHIVNMPAAANWQIGSA